MTDAQIQHVRSRENPLLKNLRRISRDPSAYRKLGLVYLEGDHLCSAALARGLRPAIGVFSESFWPSAPAVHAQAAIKNIVIDDALLAGISSLESPAPMGFVLNVPSEPAVEPGVPSVVLDRLQDAGNVGSILRSASAFGFQQVLALKGTAALWSPKVLRAGMGAHFGLRLVESVAPDQLDALALPMLVTSSHVGQWLHDTQLPSPCAWVFGHEGEGVAVQLAERAVAQVRIVQPGGEESLNVAAAAAICLHASAAAACAAEPGRDARGL